MRKEYSRNNISNLPRTLHQPSSRVQAPGETPIPRDGTAIRFAFAKEKGGTITGAAPFYVDLAIRPAFCAWCIRAP